MKQISDVKAPFPSHVRYVFSNNNDHRFWKSNNVDNEIFPGDQPCQC
jgi:hypothetical protein